MIQATLQSPIGTIVVGYDDRHVLAITIVPQSLADAGERMKPAGVAADAIDQLKAYFEGSLTRFQLPLQPLASARGEALRQAICAIPYGESLSYGGVARTINSGPRAIGQACRRNPLPIIVPCHRVTASNGLGHYSGGNGQETKTWLLRHERSNFLSFFNM